MYYLEETVMKRLLGSLFLAITSLSYSYMNIYPTIFDKDIAGAGEIEEYRLYNGTMEPLKYIFSLEKASEGRDMSRWGEYYPKTLSLKPGQEGTVKVYVKAPKSAEEGEYTAIFGIKELPVPDEEEMKRKSSSIRIYTNLKMEIAGFVGKNDLELDSKDIVLEKGEKGIKFSGTVRNTGMRRGTMGFYLSDSKERDMFYLGERRMLAGEILNLQELNQEIKEREAQRKIKRLNTLVIKEKGKTIKRIKI